MRNAWSVIHGGTLCTKIKHKPHEYLSNEENKAKPPAEFPPHYFLCLQGQSLLFCSHHHDCTALVELKWNKVSEVLYEVVPAQSGRGAASKSLCVVRLVEPHRLQPTGVQWEVVLGVGINLFRGWKKKYCMKIGTVQVHCILIWLALLKEKCFIWIIFLGAYTHKINTNPPQVLLEPQYPYYGHWQKQMHNHA